MRIYKYDNVKALLIFLVVVGHMTTDYVSDSHLVRWVTLWIYMFHMPAFIFISGLVHKRYVTEERAALGERGETRLRLDKVLGFFLCGYTLKIFLQLSRTWMGQNPAWHWIEEPGIPWYLFVMAEYELLFYLLRRIDGGGTGKEPAGAAGVEPETGSKCSKGAERVQWTTQRKNGIRRVLRAKDVRPVLVIAGAFVLSAAVGYVPAVGDTFCLARMINFLPIYALGYYMDMKKFLSFIEGNKNKEQKNNIIEGDKNRKFNLTNPPAADKGRKNVATEKNKYYLKAFSWMIIAASLICCYLAPWGGYSRRKWFTGRRSYEYLSDFYGSTAISYGWAIRLLVWAVAILITLAIITLIPNRDLGFITTVGARTLNVYFWHRPLCYLFRNWEVLPKLCVLFGVTYSEAAAGTSRGLAFGGSPWSMLAAFIAYLLIAAAMTALFSLRAFDHPCSDLMRLSRKIQK